MVDFKPVSSGVHKVILDQVHKDLLSSVPDLSLDLAEKYCKTVANDMGLDLYNHTIYDYQRILQRDHISGRFMDWHTDLDPKMDCILMYYICNPDLNKDTGMRVGYRDLEIPESTRYMDLNTGSCFLVRHDHPRYEHCIETRKRPIQRRICVSMMMRGYNNLGLN